jgi:hypothetical protein
MRLFFSLICALLSGLPATAQRLHMVYVLEKNDRDYGLLNLENETHMAQVMETVKWGIGYTMTTTYLPKTDFTSAALRRTLAALKTRPQDIIVLYYSGFGTPPASRTATFANWRLTDVPTQGLPLSQVEGWLSAKKVRLSVIFADCSAQRTRNDTRLEASPGIIADKRKQVIQNLFLKTCGLVKLGSALPSQPAWVLEKNKGTVFTSALNSAFGAVLRFQDPAQVASASWQTIDHFAGMNMNMVLVDMPFSQQPVLEQRSCRPVVAAMPAPLPPPDPFANETIAALLNACITAQDSAQREQRTRQLYAVCPENTTLTVGRELTDDKINPVFPKPLLDSLQADLNTRPTRYTLAEYLAQVCTPFVPKAAGGGPSPVPRLRVVYVENKQLDAAAGNVTGLTLYEAWVF